LSEAVQGFSSLPCTEYELKSLHTLYDVHHKYLINKEFTISNLYQNIKHKNFSIVHIASHGQFSAVIEFYRQLQNPALSKAEALQNAQKMMLTNKDYVHYQHPYYWAAFLLIGNWF